MAVTVLIFAFMASGCGRKEHNPKLDRIAATISDDPHSALDSLLKIDTKKLTETDKHYYDFLTLKTRDKAFIQHTSDSAFLNLLDYYPDTNPLYPELMYYGGRVYSDLGDLPTASKYFHKALDLLPEDTNDKDLRGNVLSQLGRLCQDLHLKSEAEKYLKQVIKLEEEMKDSTNLAFDNMLLGHVYLYEERAEEAERQFNKVASYQEVLPEYYRPQLQAYQAAAKFHKYQLDSALDIIRGVPEKIDSLGRNMCLGYAAKIYLLNNSLDTAEYYAKELINSPVNQNKRDGYRVLLSEELRNRFSQDSLAEFLSDYEYLCENEYNENNSEQVITQLSRYNYKFHEKKARQIEKSYSYLIKISAIFIFLSLILTIILLVRKNQQTKKIAKLNSTIYNLTQLNDSLKIKTIPNLLLRQYFLTMQMNSD